MSVVLKAFILIKVDPGYEEEVMDALMEIPDVKESHIVPGDWDIVAVMSTPKAIALPGDEKIYRLVLQRINKIKHVQDTNTMVSQISRSR